MGRRGETWGDVGRDVVATESVIFSPASGCSRYKNSNTWCMQALELYFLVTNIPFQGISVAKILTPDENRYHDLVY